MGPGGVVAYVATVHLHLHGNKIYQGSKAVNIRQTFPDLLSYRQYRRCTVHRGFASYQAAPLPAALQGTVFQRDMQGRCRRFAAVCVPQTLHIPLKHRMLNATDGQWGGAATPPRASRVPSPSFSSRSPQPLFTVRAPLRGIPPCEQLPSIRRPAPPTPVRISPITARSCAPIINRSPLSRSASCFSSCSVLKKCKRLHDGV